MNSFDELIVKSEKEAKDCFLNFVTNIYNINGCVFEHILNVPVISLEQCSSVVSTPLSSKTIEELEDIIFSFIKEELGNSNISCVFLDKLVSSFSIYELDEWNNIKNNQNTCFIVYNKAKLIEKYNEFNNDIFVCYVKKIILYQLCLLNFSNIINKFNSSKTNESLLYILSYMINVFEKGFSVYDCLFKVIKDSSFKSNNLDVLTIYVLFANELTEWILFGSYELDIENKFEKLFVNVCGDDKFSNFKDKVKEYIKKLDEKLTDKQIEMLELLGVNSNSNSVFLIKVNDKPNIFKRFFNSIMNLFSKK